MEPVEVPTRAFLQVGARVSAGVWAKGMGMGHGE